MNKAIFLFIFTLSIVVITYVPTIIEMRREQPRLFFALGADSKYFSLGYRDLIADVMWIRVLQDFDTCEQIQTDSSVNKVRIGKNRKSTCTEGWVYHILDVAIEMAPKWRLVQRVGPMMLSVVVDDRDGATKLFKKAIANFPNDWPILIRAGYHFLFEEQDLLLAARVFEAAAAQEGAPEWCKLLAGKLYLKSGRLHIAKMVLEDYLKRTPDDTVGYKKAVLRLAEVNQQLEEAEKKNNK